MGCSETPLGHHALLVIKEDQKDAFNNWESIVPKGVLEHPIFNSVAYMHAVWTYNNIIARVHDHIIAVSMMTSAHLITTVMVR